MVIVLWWAGCSGSGQARAVVTELCKWGQLSELTPAVLPPEVDLTTRVRDADLRWARAERLEPSTENPFLAKNQTVGLVADDAARALQQAVAQHAQCTVEVSVDGDHGTAHVERVAPRPLDGQDLFVRLGELQALADHPARVAKIEEWIAANPASATTTHDLKVDRVGDTWIVNFGLPEARVAESRGKLDAAEATITKGRADEAQLAKLVVLDTTYFPRASPRVSSPRVDIHVRNDLDTRVSKVVFRGVLTSPDKPDPWVDDELTHEPLSRFEPGDEDTWTIVSRLPGHWRTGAPEGSTLTLTPVQLFGPKQALLYDVRELPDALTTAETMKAEIARVEAAYLTGAPPG
ncbi:MAG: hypothetical protein ABMA64_36040 [Myxococcota bacterium]